MFWSSDWSVAAHPHAHGLRLAMLSTWLTWLCVKAWAAWQWYNYLECNIPAGKRALRINLDETSICLFQGATRGNICLSKTEPRVQHARLGERRTYMSHVALVCDDQALQLRMPQFILVNTRTLSADTLIAIRARIPVNYIVLRGKSAWNNGALCSKIVRRMCTALDGHLHALQPILLFDSVRIHTVPQMWRTCTDNGVWALVVPAKLTWLLQPLDTHVFALYKARLSHETQMSCIAAGRGLDVGMLIDAICVAGTQVLEGRSWDHAFDQTGFGRSQRSLGGRVVSGLDLSAAIRVPCTRPTLGQLAACFPRRTCVPVAAIWRQFDGPSESERAVVAPAAAPIGAAPSVLRSFGADGLLRRPFPLTPGLANARLHLHPAAIPQTPDRVSGPAVVPRVVIARRLPPIRTIPLPK